MTFSAGLFCGQAKQSNNRWNITVSNQQCKLLKYKKSCTQPPAGWLKSCQKISDFKYFPCAWWAWVWTLHTHAVCRGLCGLQCGHYGGCLWRCLADILLRILWYWFMISGGGGTRPAPPRPMTVSLFLRLLLLLSALPGSYCAHLVLPQLQPLASIQNWGDLVSTWAAQPWGAGQGKRDVFFAFFL